MGGFQRGYGDFPEFDGPTISASRMPPDCPVPVRLNLSLAEANARARRAFWRGWVFGIISTLTCAALGIWLLMVLA
jgi:hypothetical protein